jgi:hypothetical protein
MGKLREDCEIPVTIESLSMGGGSVKRKMVNEEKERGIMHCKIKVVERIDGR